jgi:hypothetical protein
MVKGLSSDKKRKNLNFYTMKKLPYIILLAAGVTVTACGDKELDTKSSLSIREEFLTLELQATATTVSNIAVEANVAWVPTVAADGTEWLTAESLSGGQFLQLKATANTSLEVRSTTVSIGASGVPPVQISVAQLGQGAEILLSAERKTMLPEGGRFSVVVTANVSYTISIAEADAGWVSLDTLNKGAGKDTAWFVVAPYTFIFSDRSTLVDFKELSGTAKSLRIIQEKRPYISGSDDFPQDTMLRITGGETDGGSTATGLFEKSYDGDPTTMYHTKTNPTNPVVMSWAVSNAKQLDYLVYTPRSSGPNGTIGKLSIAVQYAGSTAYVPLGDYDFGMVNAASRVDFSPALKNVARVQFSVSTAGTDGTGSFFVSVAEIAFYKRGQGGMDPLEIFTDAACTALKPGITPDDISNIPVELYKSIAVALNNPNPDQVAAYREFRMGEFHPYYSPTLDAARNKTAKFGVRENPTGISVSTGEELTVLASGIPSGQSISLKVQAIAGHSETVKGYDLGPSVNIVNGANSIKLPTFAGSPGLVYVQYQINSEGALPNPVKIHFAKGGKLNGYFDNRRYAAEDFQRILSASDADNLYFDIIGKYASVTLKKANISQPARGKEFIDAMDSVVWIEWKFAGLLPPPLGYGGQHRTHGYFINLPMAAGVGAYASDYHTAYPDGQFQNLTNPSKLLNETSGTTNREVTWVLGHEHGHVNQLRPAFRWAGMTEVTNNIMAQYLQTHLCDYFPTSKSTRLTSRLWYDNRYQLGANTYFIADVPHNTAAVDVWLKLVPFWQLHLYLTDVLGKGTIPSAGFYADVYEYYRKSDPNASSRTAGQHQLEFVKVVCQKANLNLEAFFTQWGFLRPINESVNDYGEASLNIAQAQIDATLTLIRQYPSPATPVIHYINDDNVSLYQNNTAIVQGGKYTVFGSTILVPPMTWSGVVAWELYDGSLGTLKQVFVNNTKMSSYAGVSSGDKLYAVSVAGDRVEVGRN